MVKALIYGRERVRAESSCQCLSGFQKASRSLRLWLVGGGRSLVPSHRPSTPGTAVRPGVVIATAAAAAATATAGAQRTSVVAAVEETKGCRVVVRERERPAMC